MKEFQSKKEINITPKMKWIIAGVIALELILVTLDYLSWMSVLQLAIMLLLGVFFKAKNTEKLVVTNSEVIHRNSNSIFWKVTKGNIKSTKQDKLFLIFVLDNNDSYSILKESFNEKDWAEIEASVC